LRLRAETKGASDIDGIHPVPFSTTRAWSIWSDVYAAITDVPPPEPEFDREPFVGLTLRTVLQRHDIGFPPGEVARMGAANLLCRTRGDELMSAN
jgi:hypothetical protein